MPTGLLKSPVLYRYLLAGVIFFAGAFLRFHALDRQSLWDDEMSTVKTISLDRRGMMVRFRTYETHPPLYFLQLRAWKALGNHSLVRLRANSAFWGCAGLLLLFGLARRYGGWPAALMTLALAALSPFHVAYSQEMRPYALAMAIAIAGMWLVEIVVNGGSGRGNGEDALFKKDLPCRSLSHSRLWFLALTLCWTAQLYTHYWGAFVVGAQALYGVWRAPSAESRKKIVFAALISGALFCAWLPILVAQLRNMGAAQFWTPPFGVANLLKTFAAYCGLFFNMASWSFYLPTRLFVWVLIGLVFAASMIVGMRRLRGPTVWLTAGLLVPWLVSYWARSLYVWYRYPTHMLPAFLLLVGAGLCALRPRAIAAVAISICLAANAWGCVFYFTRFQKANPKIVVTYIHHIRTPAAVVVRPIYFSDLFRFYDQETTRAVDEHLYDTPERRAMLRTKQVILVAFDTPQDDVADAFLHEYKIHSRQYFPGLAHLGITVYDLRAN